MFRLGLTGSIGMGKSATAAMFRARGVPVHDTDGAVHALYRGRAAVPIGAAFPGTVVDGIVDRTRLGAAVLGGDGEALRRLEALVHPLVRAEEEAFLARAETGGVRLVVLDIPLLFETGGAARLDAVVVATTDAERQRARVLERPGMSEAKLDAILAKQMPDAEKRRRAHFLVDTGSGFPRADAEVSGILRALAGRSGRVRTGAGR